jgi:uncharacterized membrane protein
VHPTAMLNHEGASVFGIHFIWLGGLLFVVALVVVIVVVIVAAARPHPPSYPPPGARPPGGAPGDAPLDILARRFASGEISAEEYEKGRDLLTRHQGPAGP